MWPAKAFSMVCRGIQEKSSNLKIFEKCVRLHLSHCISTRTVMLSQNLFLCTATVYVFLLLYHHIRRYGPLLNAVFSKWSLSQINCPPLDWDMHLGMLITVSRLQWFFKLMEALLHIQKKEKSKSTSNVASAKRYGNAVPTPLHHCWQAWC